MIPVAIEWRVRCRGVVGTEFFHQVLAVFFNSLDAGSKFVGGLFVCQSFGDQLEDLCFAGLQLVRPSCHFWRQPEEYFSAFVLIPALQDARTAVDISFDHFTGHRSEDL